MRYVKGQLVFDGEKIGCAVYDDETEIYPSFLKRLKREGREKISVPLRSALDYASFICSEWKMEICGVEFMEEDLEIEAEAKALLREAENGRKSRLWAVEGIRLLAEDRPVDVKRIRFKGILNGSPCMHFIQSNGLVGADAEHYAAVIDELCAFMNSRLSSGRIEEANAERRGSLG